MRNIYTKIGRVLFVAFLPVIRVVLRRTKRVYVAICFEGELLIVKNWLARDTWRLPGGGKKSSETYEEAVCREASEELGITISTKTLVRLGSFHATTDSLGFMYEVFLFQCKARPVLSIDHLEITDYCWAKQAPLDSSDELRSVFQALSSTDPLSVTSDVVY